MSAQFGLGASGSSPPVSFTIVRKNGDKYEVFVDAADYDAVMAAGPWSVNARHEWWSRQGRRRRRYVVVKRSVQVDGHCTSQLLHRFLLNPADGLEVDHIDGNPLNNIRSNLRVVTHAANTQNLAIHRDNVSGHRGVHWRSKNRKWRAQIMVNSRFIYLGDFTNLSDAVAAYDAASAKFHPFASHRRDKVAAS